MRSWVFSFHSKENSRSKSWRELIHSNYSWLQCWTNGWVCFQKYYFNNWKLRDSERVLGQLASHPGSTPQWYWLDCRTTHSHLGRDSEKDRKKHRNSPQSPSWRGISEQEGSREHSLWVFTKVGPGGRWLSSRALTVAKGLSHRHTGLKTLWQRHCPLF